MKMNSLALGLAAALALGSAASAQSLRIERHDNWRGDSVRTERVERHDRIEMREPRTTGTVVHGRSMAPGQLKKRLGVQTGREAMERVGRKPMRDRDDDVVVIQRNRR